LRVTLPWWLSRTFGGITNIRSLTIFTKILQSLPSQC